MDVSRIQVDMEIRRDLGDQAVSDLAALIEPSGDCVICHDTLTDSQVTLTVHAAATEPLLVLPAHASCQPSSLVTHPAGGQPFPPALEHRVMAFLLPVPSVAAPRKWALRASRRAQVQEVIPTVLINPSVDVQIGDVVDGRWRSSWEESAELLGLTRLTLDHQVPSQGEARWSVNLVTESEGEMLVIDGFLGQYKVTQIDRPTADLIRAGGSCLIWVSDLLRSVGRRMDPDHVRAAFAAERGTLYGAWAGLGATRVPLVAPETDETKSAVPPGPDARHMRRTDDIEAQVADIKVQARASFADHRAVGLRSASPADSSERLPVLLLEPRYMLVRDKLDSGSRREMRVESAIGRGLERMGTGDTLPLSDARDWRVIGAPGVVELLGPFGEPVARGPMKFPPHWLAEADRIGRVLVIYGPLIGVRSPNGRPYNDLDRLAELDKSRRDGIAAWGIVAWQNSHHGLGNRNTSDVVRDNPGRSAFTGDPEELERVKEKMNRMQKFSVSVDNSISSLIDPTSLCEWVTNLWPVMCQSCGHALGSKVDISVDGVVDGDKVLVSMHHASCRPSSVTPPGGISMTAATASYAAGSVGAPDAAAHTGIPVMVVNPSCEQLILRRTQAGTWDNSTLDDFSKVGFVHPSGTVPPVVRAAKAHLAGDQLTVEVTTASASREISEWSLRSTPDHVCEQIERLSGLVVALTTKALPTRLDISDLPAAFSDEESLVGWVPLVKSTSSQRRGKVRR
jgi:hypothetical protein